MIKKEDRILLLSVARQSISHAVRGEEFDPEVPGDGPLSENRGAFVTLTQGGALRGCIGLIISDRPLVQVVAEMARAAALDDPRFPEVREEELSGLEIEVSAMSPIRTIQGPEDIEIGRDGLIIHQEGRSGLLLPQVAGDRGWDALRFLEETCQKAGLPGNAWEEGAQIEAFGAEVWSE
jgi:AmmeMemoRadiSam system protein A